MPSADRTAGARRRAIYLDYHATTPTDPRVIEVVLRHLTEVFGNAHSRDHEFGDAAEDAVERARAEVASLVGGNPNEVIFTSGATEALNLALWGLAREVQRKRPGHPLRLAVSAAEHAAVLDTARALEDARMAVVTVLPVDRTAHVELSALESVCKSGVDLVAIMAASNEVGTITDSTSVAGIVHERGALYLCDGTQAVGKVAAELPRFGADLLALSAHKFYGPKGAGALVVRSGIRLSPILFGGGHERGMRSGTLNVPAIAGLGEAARLRRLEMIADEAAVQRLRDRLQHALVEAVPDLMVSGHASRRLAGNLHVCVPGIPNQAVIARVRGTVALSTGAACSSGIEAPSHVLLAMGLTPAMADGALRFGLGKFLASRDVDEASEEVVAAIGAVRSALQLTAR